MDAGMIGRGRLSPVHPDTCQASIRRLSFVLPMASPLRLNLLGSFEASSSAGEPVSITGRKLHALLAFLAIERRREHQREELATLLWGEMMHERSRHNLRQALSKLRRIRDDLLVVHDDTLALNSDACSVDVEEFERLADSDQIADLERAVALYRGDLLAGVVTLEPGFDDWLRGARARLRETACGAVDRLAKLLAGAERWDEAVHLLQKRLAMDSACEAAHRQIMRLLDRCGRRSDALRQFEQCVEALEREFGAAPSRDTVAVRDTILGSDSPVARSAGQPASPSAVRPERDHRTDPPSVAVLPFENLSGEDDRYFVEGLCEDLTTALSRFSTLFVIARASANRFRDQDAPVAEVNEALRADYVVRGSVQRLGQTLRLNVQLLDAVTGQHRWAQRFDADLPDILVLQDEITATVVSTLAGRVEADGIARARRMPADRLDAYDLVLRGKDFPHRHTPEDCMKAIERFERAIERDQDYALPHAWLACCYGQEMSYRPDETWSLMERAHVAAERGRDLDENESECHRILAQVFILRRDLARSQSHQDRALLLNAHADRSVCAMGEILILRGRPQEAEPWVRKAMRLNPYHPESYWFHLGRSLFHAGRLDDAREAFGRITQPRTRDLVYWLAASEGPSHREARDRLLEMEPGFDAESFVSSLPYEREDEPARLLAALVARGE